jgi:hypothetical protein
MKLSKLFPVLVIGVLFLSACVANGAVATSTAVQLPDALKLAINGLVLFGVMFGLQFVFDKFHLDLRGIGAAVALAVSEFAILQLQGLIDVVPMQYDLLVTVALNVILAVLTSLGFARVALHRERARELLG